jgi:hypothetical protein
MKTAMSNELEKPLAGGSIHSTGLRTSVGSVEPRECSVERSEQVSLSWDSGMMVQRLSECVRPAKGFPAMRKRFPLIAHYSLLIAKTECFL